MTTTNPVDLDNFPRLATWQFESQPGTAHTVALEPVELGNFPTVDEALAARRQDVAAVTDALVAPIVETLTAVVRATVNSKLVASDDLRDALAAYEKCQDVLEKVAAWMREEHLAGVPMYYTVLDALEA